MKKLFALLVLGMPLVAFCMEAEADKAAAPIEQAFNAGALTMDVANRLNRANIKGSIGEVSHAKDRALVKLFNGPFGTKVIDYMNGLIDRVKKGESIDQADKDQAEVLFSLIEWVMRYRPFANDPKNINEAGLRKIRSAEGYFEFE